MRQEARLTLVDERRAAREGAAPASQGPAKAARRGAGAARGGARGAGRTAAGRAGRRRARSGLGPGRRPRQPRPRQRRRSAVTAAAPDEARPETSVAAGGTLLESARFYDVLFGSIFGFVRKQGNRGDFEKSRFTHTLMSCFVLSFCETESIPRKTESNNGRCQVAQLWCRSTASDLTEFRSRFFLRDFLLSIICLL